MCTSESPDPMTITLHGKGVYTDVIKLKISFQSPDGPKVTMRVLMMWRGEAGERGDVSMEAEVRERLEGARLLPSRPEDGPRARERKQRQGGGLSCGTSRALPTPSLRTHAVQKFKRINACHVPHATPLGVVCHSSNRELTPRSQGPCVCPCNYSLQEIKAV